MTKLLRFAAPLAVLGYFFALSAWAAPTITQLSAELEMKDFHDTETIPGPLKPGVPITVTFKNDAVVELLPIAIQDKTIRLQAELLKSSGSVLYNETFFTKYDADAEISEKTPKGDLVYRLKLNPHTAQQ